MPDINEDALEGLDPAFLKENDLLVTSYRDIRWDSMPDLTKLVQTIEGIIVKYKEPNDKIKEALELIYRQILGRYPYLHKFWKRFIAAEYQLYGLKRSINILSQAVSIYPSSIDLWCDYLNVLVVNNSDDHVLIKTQFEAARDAIGEQFLSHPFWDKYLEYSSKQSNTIEYVRQIYDVLIDIPLYQYAKYYKANIEFLREHGIKFDEAHLKKRLARTQSLVRKFWEFESKIKQTSFQIDLEIDKVELQVWDQYLKSAISDPEVKPEIIESIFNRCLVPYCQLEYFWLKYAQWAINRGKAYETLLEIFVQGNKNIANNTSFKTLHLQYISNYCLQIRNNSVLVDTIAGHLSKWPQDRNALIFYFGNLQRIEYKTPLDSTAKNLEEQVLSQQRRYQELLDSCIQGYLHNKENTRRPPLQRLINDYNIDQVAVELIKVTWQRLKQTVQCRKYFNAFSKNAILRRSTPFWVTYYNFEKHQRNFQKLDKFVEELGKSIYLPTIIINDIISDYRSFYLMNASPQEYLESVVDPILSLSFKINDPQGTTLPRDKASFYKSAEYKENGHPAVIVERPQIINDHLEINSQKMQLDLPILRNLEKIGQQPKFNESPDATIF